MHLLVVEVTVIEVYAIMFVVVNLLSSLVVVADLSLLRSSLIVISRRTIILSPFVC